MTFETMQLGPLGTNCYIIWNGQEALIIDPGGDADYIISFLNERNIRPIAVLLTHAHFDHIGGLDDLCQKYDVNVYVHELEWDWLDNPHLNGSAQLLGQEITAHEADYRLIPGAMQFGSFSFRVVHTPGHSPGSVSFIFAKEKVIFGGDVLFYQGIGRTDLPGGNSEQLKHSIINKFYGLADDVVVYPGHGPATIIGKEKELNPFVHL